MSIYPVLGRFALFSALLIAGGAYLFEDLKTIFHTNLILNSCILGVFFFGFAFNVWRLLALNASVSWLQDYGLQYASDEEVPLLLLPTISQLAHRDALTPAKVDHLLEGLALKGRLRQVTSRYLMGALVFLGLIGTFWGLSMTIGSIGQVIQTLPDAGNASGNYMTLLKGALNTPLDGMSLAFSSSLFGIAGSLILGFFDMQAAGFWQHFFYTFEKRLFEIEEKKSAEETSFQPRGGHVSNAYIQVLMGQTHETIEKLSQNLIKGDQSRLDLNKNLHALTERLAKLADQRETEKNLLIKVAEGQIEFQNHLRRFGDKITEGDFGLDAGTRNHVRNLDASILRLLETVSQGQQGFSQDMKNELRLVTKMLGQLSSEKQNKLETAPYKKTTNSVGPKAHLVVDKLEKRS